jgi:hypothetical protein
MKTNPSFRIFKPSTLVSLGIAIAAALVTQPVRAVAITNFLVITENNSTSLTATLNGNALGVTNPGADLWFIALNGIASSAGEQFWTEPDASGTLNIVQARVDRIAVLSDQVLTGGLADDTPDTTTFTLNGVALSVTFDDDGDVAAVPDTGSTLGLLSLSVVALLGATRLRFLQLAA